MPAQEADVALDGMTLAEAHKTPNMYLLMGSTGMLGITGLPFLLSGQFMLPPRGRMERAVELERAWKRTWMPPTSARASLFQLHMPKYHDQLIKDLGEPHLRKGLNKVAEVFQPYSAADYKDLFA